MLFGKPLVNIYRKFFFNYRQYSIENIQYSRVYSHICLFGVIRVSALSSKFDNPKLINKVFFNILISELYILVMVKMIILFSLLTTDSSENSLCSVRGWGGGGLTCFCSLNQLSATILVVLIHTN